MSARDIVRRLTLRRVEVLSRTREEMTLVGPRHILRVLRLDGPEFWFETRVNNMLEPGETTVETLSSRSIHFSSPYFQW